MECPEVPVRSLLGGAEEVKFGVPRGAQVKFGCPRGVPRDAQEVKFGVPRGTQEVKFWVPKGARAEGWDSQRCP